MRAAPAPAGTSVGSPDAARGGGADQGYRGVAARTRRRAAHPAPRTRSSAPEGHAHARCAVQRRTLRPLAVRCGRVAPLQRGPATEACRRLRGTLSRYRRPAGCHPRSGLTPSIITLSGDVVVLHALPDLVPARVVILKKCAPRENGHGAAEGCSTPAPPSIWVQWCNLRATPARPSFAASRRRLRLGQFPAFAS
jgi:hypothetical protein